MGLGWRALGLVVLVALVGCDRSAETPPGTTEVPPGAESTPVAAEAGPAVDEGGFSSTPISPTRSARLVTQAEGSQINLRSQPTTQSPAQGYGLGGDSITLLRLAEGEGGFSWYYVRFAQSGAEGWVRGDFIDTSAQATSPDPALGTNPAIGTGPCGDSNRPEAYFETKSFTIHLCQTAQGLSYIGINKTTNDTLTTADVRNSQGTYIAINGNYQYHINEKSLAVYEVTGGSYNQLEGETVIRHEQFQY